MSAELSVIPNGTQVNLSGDGAISGVVTSICIAGESHVTYQVSWWNGRSLESKWCEAFQVNPVVSTSRRIGFTQQ